MTKEIERWWDSASSFYQESSQIGTSSAHYGPYAPNENRYKLLGNIKRKRILEIGCGGGQCSIAFAKQGAKCTGLDLSSEQIRYAERLAKRNKVLVKFQKHDIQTLDGLKSNYYDIVFSAYALQYVHDITKCFKEVLRVLKKGGLFVFSLEHPFYSSISTKTFKIDKRYNKSEKIKEIETWPDGSKHIFVAYRRKISEIFESLLKAGFLVEKIIEPFDKNAESAWTKGYWKKIYPQKLIEMVGPTIIFKARKSQ